MHQNKIRLDVHCLKLGDQGFYVLEMQGVEPLKIPNVAFVFPVKAEKFSLVNMLESIGVPIYG